MPIQESNEKTLRGFPNYLIVWGNTITTANSLSEVIREIREIKNKTISIYEQQGGAYTKNWAYLCDMSREEIR